jgi:hypothetical protein
MVLIFSSSPTGFASVSPTDLAMVPIFRSLSIYRFDFQLLSTIGGAVWLLWTRNSVHVCILHLPLNRRTGTENICRFCSRLFFTVRMNNELKRSLIRDFQLQVYFINRFPLGPEYHIPFGSFRFFSQIRGDFRDWKFISGVNDTSDKREKCWGMHFFMIFFIFF